LLKNIIEDYAFKDLTQNHTKEIIQYIVAKNVEFSVVANIKAISFEPDLPKDIKEKLKQFSLFKLAGYTFTTVKIDDNFLFFEAGFGKNNFGSLVKIPLYSILQIIVDDNILYVNLSATIEKFIQKDLKEVSLNIFKNNPKNKRFT